MALPASFPTRFGDWTEAQKQTGLQTVTRWCGTMYAFTGDDPKARLVPDTMTRQEAATLAVSVCVPANLPKDWPSRQKYLGEAQRLIAKANSLGGVLHLPQSLLPN